MLPMRWVISKVKEEAVTAAEAAGAEAEAPQGRLIVP